MELRKKFPTNTFPSKDKYVKCLNNADAHHEGLIAFIKDTYKKRVSWDRCSWDYIFSIPGDTLILPCYVFSSSYLRYYLPAFFLLSRLTIYENQHEKEIFEGPSDMVNSLFWQVLSDHVAELTSLEKEIAIELIYLARESYQNEECFKDSEFYFYGRKLLTEL